jgi:hypothetical protein
MDEQLQNMLDQGTNVDVATALLSLRPGARWIIRGNEYSGLEWKDTLQTAPTEQEVLDEIESLNSYQSSRKYRSDRKDAYHTIEEQLDLLYWDQVNGTTNWKDHVAKVKADHPKPE